MEGKKGKSRGYGFVDMPNEEEKNAAITALEGKEFMWRVLSVRPVIPKVKSEVKSDRDSKPRGRTSKSSSASEGGSKYYSKFDGPPKPWRKRDSDIKPSRKKDKGSRPYYGKKDKEAKPSSSSKPPYKKFESQSKPLAKREEGSKFSNKPKLSKGFKMFHKVSGASKTGAKRVRTDGI